MAAITPIKATAAATAISCAVRGDIVFMGADFLDDFVSPTGGGVGRFLTMPSSSQTDHGGVRAGEVG
jgi:hypothetical protein